MQSGIFRLNWNTVAANTINSRLTGAIWDFLKNEVFLTVKKLQKQAYSLINKFNYSFNQSAHFSTYDIEVQNTIHDTLQILENPKASYKASDYVISRFYARISKLIGFHSIEISDETKNIGMLLSNSFNLIL